MIVLDTSGKKLEVVLAGAVTANQLDVNSYYFDQYPQLQTQPRSGHSFVQTNGVTDVTAVAAPALVGIRRNIHTMSVYNKDTASATVTVKIDDGGSERILVKQTLNAGDSLNYEHGAGWTFTTPVSVPFTDTLNLVKGSADGTKQLRIEVDGLTTNTTRVWTAPDADLTVVGTAPTQTLTNKTLTSPDLTGTPTAPTAAVGTNTTQVATTEFVQANTALVLLGSATASASASLSFVHTGGTGTVVFDWTAYDEYEFHFVRIVPATNAVNLNSQISQDSGTTYKAGAGAYTTVTSRLDGTPQIIAETAASTAWTLSYNSAISNSSNYGFNGVLRMYKPSAAVGKGIDFNGHYNASSGTMTSTRGMFWYTADTNAWTGIKFLMASGNIASGVIHGYGIKKS